MTKNEITQKAWDYALISVKGDVLPVANMHLLAANIQVILDTELAPLQAEIEKLRAQPAAAPNAKPEGEPAG